jgi:hypothetical protein
MKVSNNMWAVVKLRNCCGYGWSSTEAQTWHLGALGLVLGVAASRVRHLQKCYVSRCTPRLASPAVVAPAPPPSPVRAASFASARCRGVAPRLSATTQDRGSMLHGKGGRVGWSGFGGWDGGMGGEQRASQVHLAAELHRGAPRQHRTVARSPIRRRSASHVPPRLHLLRFASPPRTPRFASHRPRFESNGHPRTKHRARRLGRAQAVADESPPDRTHPAMKWPIARVKNSNDR